MVSLLLHPGSDKTGLTGRLKRVSLFFHISHDLLRQKVRRVLIERLVSFLLQSIKINF